MKALKSWLRGGSDANAELTAIVAALLLVLLAVEGATLMNLTALLTVHAFVGMLLIPVVCLKLASTGWRMLCYYRRVEEYARRGPPHVVLRMFLAPVTVVSTVVLFVTGVLLLAFGETHGTLVGLHKASFVVWLGAMSLHVLTRVWKLAPTFRRHTPGRPVRYALAGASLTTGLVLATVTFPAADRLQDTVSATIGLDVR